MKPKKKHNFNPLPGEEQTEELSHADHDAVEELLEEVLIAEATAAVWKRFEQALQSLDPDSLALFEEYLEGVNVSELATSRSLTEKELETWKDKVKRDLIQTIKNDHPVRN